LRVESYYDEGNLHSIDIFTSRNDTGVVAATIGLMDINQSRRPGVDLCAELLVDVRGGNQYLCNILSSIGFFIIKDGWKVAPGVVFEKMISMYMSNSLMKHVMFMPAYQWDEGMIRVYVGSKMIYPLLCVPITEEERKYVVERGADALKERWVDAGTDVLDWKRGQKA
jgi:hypothetical protein